MTRSDQAPNASRSGPCRKFTCLVAVIAALHAAAWSYVLPPGQGPDEEAHFGAVEHIYVRWTPPIIYKDFHLTKNWREALETTGFSRIRLVRFLKPTFAEHEDGYPVGEFTEGYSYHSGSPGGPPLTYYLLAALYALIAPLETLTKLYVLRLWGAAMFAIVAAVTYRLFCAVEGDSAEARAGALIVSLFPMTAFLCGYVTTDSLAMAVMAVAMAAGIGALNSPTPGRTRFAVIGVVVGLAFLAKPFAASCAIPIFLLALTRRENLRPLAAFVLCAGITVLPWLLWSAQTYGGISAHAAMPSGEKPGLMETIRVYSAIISPTGLFSQAIGVFGWLDTPLPRPLRAAIGILFLLGWIFFIRNSFKGEISAAWWKIASFSLAHFVFVLAVAIQTSMSSGYRLGVQGRYLVLPIAAWAAPPIVGWIKTFPKSAYVLSSAALLNALFALGWTVIPRYFI